MFRFLLMSELWHCLTLLGVLEVFWFYATLIIFVDNNNNNNNNNNKSTTEVTAETTMNHGPAKTTQSTIRCCGEWLEFISHQKAGASLASI